MGLKIRQSTKLKIAGGVILIVLFATGYVGAGYLFADEYTRAGLATATLSSATSSIPTYYPPKLDLADYDRRMLKLANYGLAKITASSTATSHSTSSGQATIKKRPWPVVAPYPKEGAILPFKRVVAYYGNLYSKGMGVLGQYPEAEMLAKLKGEVAKWELADPETPVQPALQYIVTTAQLSGGEDDKHRLRMPTKEIDKVLTMAQKINAIVILDVQVGLSNLPAELPLLKKYLALPQVHLGIDPEFSMKTGAKPGTVIGSFNADDINYTTDYLAKLVQENNLPPKILVVHRFTGPMVTGYKQIKTRSEVQIVMDMDGWGGPTHKIATYNNFIASQPVQFTGFKLFYKNDLKNAPNRMLTPVEILRLKPRPIYIQYQ